MDDTGKIDQQSFEREKWVSDVELRRLELELKGKTLNKDDEFRRRELELKERAQRTAEAELELKRQEAAHSRWNNPVVVAIFAAALAGLANIAVTGINDYFQRETEAAKATATEKLEQGKAEAARILEMIKTNDTTLATRNLGFLVDTGLVLQADRVKQIKAYLETHYSPVLPTASIQPSAQPIPQNTHVINFTAPLPQPSPFHLESDSSTFAVSYNVDGTSQVVGNKLLLTITGGKMASSKRLAAMQLFPMMISRLAVGLCYNTAGASRNVYPEIPRNNVVVDINQTLNSIGEISLPSAQIIIDLTPEIMKEKAWICGQLFAEGGGYFPSE